MLLTRNFCLSTNGASLLILITILLSYQLHVLTLTAAIGLVLFNLYYLISTLISPFTSQKTTSKKYSKLEGQPGFNLQKFQQKFKEVCSKKASMRYDYSSQAGRYWGRHYEHKSSANEQIRNIRISELTKTRIPQKERDDDHYLKAHMSTSKKIRNYLEVTGVKEQDSVVRAIRTFVSDKIKIGKISENNIRDCLLTLEQHINFQLSDTYEEIVANFTAVDKFLHRCFSLSLTIEPQAHNASITYSVLLQMIKIIETKGFIPQSFTPNLSLLEIKKELSSIKSKISQLPNFYYPPNLIRLSLFLEHLRRDFPDQDLVLLGVEGEKMKTTSLKSEIFKFTQNGQVYYSQVPSIRSKYTSTPILLYLLSVWHKYKNSNKSVFHDLREVLQFQ